MRPWYESEPRQARSEPMDHAENSPNDPLEGPRRPDSKERPQQEAQIEGAAVDEEPLENVLVSSKVRSAHSSRFVHVRERALHTFASLSVKALAPFAADPSSIRITDVAALFVAGPLAVASVGFRDVAPEPKLRDAAKRGIAVVALVRDDLSRTLGIGLASIGSNGRIELLRRLSEGVLDGIGVPEVRFVKGNGDEGTRVDIHRMLGLVSEVGAAILHPRDLRVWI